ncbi:MAG: hypothetical protein GF333_00480 [Candidatus Omnitrophica bacterium]|nr:hypothetical protein [Candidatus Omnitrophota bacterium]
MKSILFGIVQGLTEFLPISSSGHLFFAKRVFAFSGDAVPFFVMLHFATLGSIFVILRRVFLQSLRNIRLWGCIAGITLITGVVGLVIDIFISPYFELSWFIPALLFCNGSILLFARRRTEAPRVLGSITVKEVVLLGLLQGLAVLPGISRSGITIIGMLRQGFAGEEAFHFSFLMAIPVILVSFAVKAPSLLDTSWPAPALAAGFVAAFVSGALALLVVRRTLRSNTFYRFSYYCFVVAAGGIFL